MDISEYVFPSKFKIWTDLVVGMTFDCKKNKVAVILNGFSHF